MKTLSTAVQSILTQKLGLEPVTVVEVQWVANGPWLKYADKDVIDYEFPIDGKILEVDNIESVIKLDFQGQSQEINITLSDTGGDLKDIFNQHDLHGRACRIYQWFETLPLAERFKLFEGQITSPIEWSEGARTLKFNVITQLEDKEVGFSPEEGYFEFLPKDLVGKPWPLIFGLVQNVPAVLISEIPSSLTAEALGASDPSILERLSDLNRQYDTLEGIFQFYALAAGQAAYTASYGETEQQRSAARSAQESFESSLSTISNQMAQIKAETTELLLTLSQQRAAQNQTLTVVDGTVFPQGTQVTVIVGDTLLTGTFSGDVLDIDDINLTTYSGYNSDDPSPFGFTWYREGTTIKIYSAAPIVYIVNLLESEVKYVQAYKQVENGQVLTVVPSEWYSVKTQDLGSYTVTYLEFTRPISSFDETYSDEIYVTLESPVGPNTVDILEWLIDTYTNLSYDTTSFNLVKTQIDNYPSHFALLERKNILGLLEEIAFQARCAIWVSENTVYIKYLAVEETEVETFTEDDIDVGTLAIYTTTTEEVVTKLVANWTDDYANSEQNKIILRHNVKKYGTKEREFNFYIYNIEELVLKSATFWLIRYCNVWKNLRFVTYIDKIATETFDTVLFDFDTNYVADTDIKGTITSIIYNSDEKSLSVEAWVPVRCGEMERYDFAEPQEIDITLFYPTQDEIDGGLAGGDGPGTDVEGGLAFDELIRQNVGYVSRTTRRRNGERIQYRDYGDKIPSDLDDVKPYPKFSTNPVVAGVEPTYTYLYPKRILDLTPAPTPSEEYSFAYPGQVLSGTADSYTVAVYKEGLSNDPATVENVKQLQIAEDEAIPAGTWVIVAYNRWNEIINNETVTKEQYTMQSPVWI